MAARQLLRDSLFDAARSLLKDRPWAEITMADVAETAGVSRQTLYQQFGSREAFASQFVIREGARFLDGVERAINAHMDDPRVAISAGMEVFLTTASEDPLVRLLLDDDGTGGMLQLITTQSQPLVDWARARLCAVMRDGWPQIPDTDCELLADSFVRLALSYVAMPRDNAFVKTATDTALLLSPYIEHILSAD